MAVTSVACNDSVDALLAGARVLVVAPHPDDESLCAAGLIQRALALDAKITVLQVTNGDNNPWPQRWLERRLFIGDADRQRWGERRSAEAKAAVARLSLPASAVQRLHWHDMGVTAQMQAQGVAAWQPLAGRLQQWAPQLVVLPSLYDRHPDHGAVHVLLRLALAHARMQPPCLTYMVHGREPSGANRLCLPLTADMQQRKRQAVLEHASQTALSRGRLLARVGPHEHFCLLATAQAPLAALQPLPWRPSRWLRPGLHLRLAHPGGMHAWRLADAPIEWQGGQPGLRLEDSIGRSGPLFAKLHMRVPSPWIFDHWGWQCLTAPAALPQAAGIDTDRAKRATA